jgi:hypothetical protein
VTFPEWKASRPVRAMFRKLGLSDILDAALSWRALRALIVRFNDPDKGHFVTLVRDCDGVASSGERILLHAICYVVDFAWLADELAEGKAWRNMDRASGEHQRCVAACIGAEI